MAVRARAATRARDALAREAELAQQPGDPRTVAVLPLDITGDSTYQSLSRGLAQIITSDLDLLRQFRLVERLQVGVLMDEMHLGQTGRVEASTAARVGHLLQAGRMVQGLAAIPPEGDARLEASVVRGDGQVSAPAAQTGRLRDLLKMEKDLVIGIANQLGYRLSEAERKRILENGTQSLTAFLAYSKGLVAEDAGDYSAAAVHFGEAVRADPGFQQARQDYQTATVSEQVASAAPGDVTTVAAEQVQMPTEPVTQTAENAMSAATLDVASSPAENVTNTGTNTGTNTNSSNPSGVQTTKVTNSNVTGVIRIIFRLP
jgi:TolB-like protein